MGFHRIHQIFPLLILLDILVIFLGLVVIIAWASDTPEKIVLFPTVSPMQFNTALCFLCSGAALYLSRIQKKKTALFLSACTLIISFLTLIQYVFSIDLGIDTLFINNSLSVENSSANRMAPNSALCFILASLILFFHARSKKKEFHRVFIFLLSLTILIFSIISLSSYFIESTNIYGWGIPRKMSLYTAIGLLLFSLSVIIGHRQVVSKLSTIDYSKLPGTVFISSLLIFIVLWINLVNMEEAILKKRMQSEASNLQQDINTLLNEQYKAFQRMTWLWQGGKKTTAEWSKEAQYYYQDFNSLTAIIWLHANKTVRSVIPEKMASVVEKNSPVENTLVEKALTKALQKGSKVVSAPLVLFNEAMGFYVIFPMNITTNNMGYIIASYEFQKILHTVLLKHNPKMYSVSLLSGNKLLSRSNNTNTRYNDKDFSYPVAITLSGYPFILEITAEQALIEEYSSYLPSLVLIFGIFFSFVLSYSLFTHYSLKKKEIELGTTNLRMRRLLNILARDLKSPLIAISQLSANLHNHLKENKQLSIEAKKIKIQTESAIAVIESVQLKPQLSENCFNKLFKKIKLAELTDSVLAPHTGRLHKNRLKVVKTFDDNTLVDAVPSYMEKVITEILLYCSKVAKQESVIELSVNKLGKNILFSCSHERPVTNLSFSTDNEVDVLDKELINEILELHDTAACLTEKGSEQRIFFTLPYSGK